MLSVCLPFLHFVLHFIIFLLINILFDFSFSLDTFDSSQESQVCSLDLGGGSTQVNFMPSDGVSYPIS